MTAPRLLGVAVGVPREVPYRGRSVTTSIYKEPVEGPVHAGRLGLAGDHQSDPRYHGGPFKAVYAYPAEHDAAWRADLGRDALEPAQFGQNLTVEGLLEDEVRVGDRLRIGDALLQVTEPRFPCFKLGIRLGRGDALALMQRSGRSGFYLSVVEEGALAAGAPIEVAHRDPGGLTVLDMVRLFETPTAAGLRRALAVEALPPAWRERFAARLAEIDDDPLAGEAAAS